MAEWKYPFPSRTRKSSALTPMVLQFCGRVGSRQVLFFCFLRNLWSELRQFTRAVQHSTVPHLHPCLRHKSRRNTFMKMSFASFGRITASLQHEPYRSTVSCFAPCTASQIPAKSLSQPLGGLRCHFRISRATEHCLILRS